VWYATVLTAGLGLFGGLIWLSLRSRLIGEVDRDLEGRASRFEQYFRSESSAASGNQLRDELDEFCQALPPLSYVYLSGANGFVFRYPTAPPAVQNFRMLRRQFTSGGEAFDLEVGSPIGEVLHTLDLLRLLLLSLIPVVVAIACVGGAWLSGRALKPVEDVTNAALAISIENLSGRLPVPATGDEIASLAAVLNSMLGRLEAAVTTLSQFAGDASHELRTPLAVIRSAGENLADGVVSDPPQVMRYGGIVRDEGLRLSEMVEQVLSFAGADARSRDREPVDLVAVVERALAHEAAGIERDFAENLPRALGDAAAIERAVRNLVGNARKYAGEAAIGVRIESRPAAAPPAIAIVVWDRGPGIDPEERARLFEPFFRGRNAREAQMPGSGLGLAVVRRIAEGLGGRVEVQSAAGQGATFTLILEAAPAALEPASDVQAHPAR
jgi:signal transduction histidine kinase